MDIVYKRLKMKKAVCLLVLKEVPAVIETFDILVVERFNDIFPVKVGEYKKIKFDIKKVKNVLIHPLAEESTIFIVKQMCEKFGLPEPKKSLLYDISENKSVMKEKTGNADRK